MSMPEMVNTQQSSNLGAILQWQGEVPAPKGQWVTAPKTTVTVHCSNYSNDTTTTIL